MTPTHERAPEDPNKPFAVPEDVHESEPDGDGADAPGADLSGDPIPDDLPASGGPA